MAGEAEWLARWHWFEAPIQILWPRHRHRHRFRGGRAERFMLLPYGSPLQEKSKSTHAHMRGRCAGGAITVLVCSDMRMGSSPGQLAFLAGRAPCPPVQLR